MLAAWVAALALVHVKVAQPDAQRYRSLLAGSGDGAAGSGQILSVPPALGEVLAANRIPEQGGDAAASTAFLENMSQRASRAKLRLEAITPGEYKTRGIGLTIEYAVHDTPFGDALIAITRRGICKLSFLGSNGVDQEIHDLVKQWPHAELLNTSQHTTAVVEQAFNLKRVADRPLSLLVSGTNFQVSVWKALLKIPPGTVASYSQVAAAIGRSSAARAVGLAVGSNPVALLIPCHRVIQQSGKLGGYHWGETRKHAIHAWEAARCE